MGLLVQHQAVPRQEALQLPQPFVQGVVRHGAPGRRMAQDTDVVRNDSRIFSPDFFRSLCALCSQRQELFPVKDIKSIFGFPSVAKAVEHPCGIKLPCNGPHLRGESITIQVSLIDVEEALDVLSQTHRLVVVVSLTPDGQTKTTTQDLQHLAVAPPQVEQANGFSILALLTGLTSCFGTELYKLLAIAQAIFL